MTLTGQNQSGVAETPAASAQSSGDVNILLVDDDPRNLDVLESILDLPGYRLIRARNADQALQALISDSFALLVLDVRMPDMSGLELAHLIKQRKKTQHLPIIFLTAYYREDEHVLQGYDAGAVDYLSKPCNPAVLRSKVAAFVDLYRVNRALQEEIVERRQAEQRVAERTAEVHHLVSQLRALAAELAQTEQRERKRLATILHDYIQQLLVSGQMQLASIRREPISDRASEVVQEVQSILKEALDASRSLTVELSPPILQEAGLGAALKWLGQRLADKHNFKVEVHADEDAEPSAEEDRFLLFECARELLFNSVKHSKVSEASVTLKQTGGDRVNLCVVDNGAGFDLEGLLNRDRNGSQATFGLFSIQQRLMHMGGSMEIEAAPGCGTCITLTAPLKGLIVPQEKIRFSASIDATNSSNNGERHSLIRVLIVDDHKIMRQGLTNLLRSETDIEVIGEAENGTSAAELADQLQPDIILMDVNLGRESGLQVTRNILGLHPHIKVVGLSMHMEEHVARAMMDAGAVAYVTKGGALEDVISVIRSCFHAPAAAPVEESAAP